MVEKKKEEPKVDESFRQEVVKQAKAEAEPEKQKTLEQIQYILKEHGGLESNIPRNSEYWDLCNKYRAQ